MVGQKQQAISPLDVVKVFLRYQTFDSDCGDVITNLKAQKLTYYAQGIYLAKTGRPLFDEDFEAWTYGPVVPCLYEQLKLFKNCQIVISEDEIDAAIDKFTDKQLDVLAQVYKTFGKYSAWALRDMTHQESPWKDTELRGLISKDKIKDFFLNHRSAAI